MATKTKTEAPRPTRKELDEWAELETERLELGRRTKAIVALQEKVEGKALAYAQANADATRVVVCHSFRLELVTKRASVRWKDEFIREKGLDAAEALVAAAPTHEEVKIHKP